MLESFLKLLDGETPDTVIWTGLFCTKTGRALIPARAKC